jgi:alkylation response protein AidB-like acyl-CoA dehydrogenase
MPVWLADVVASGRLRDDPFLRDKAMRLFAHEEAVRASQLVAAARGAAGSGLKLHGAATFKRRAELMLHALGPAGMLAGTNAEIDFLTAPSMSIRGGTDEIQRNVLGERVLGLPSEPRVDKDVPWSQSRKGVT